MTTNNKKAIISNNIKQRVTLFVKPQILKQARAQAVVEDITLTGLVEKALIKYLPVKTIIKKVDLGKEVV